MLTVGSLFSGIGGIDLGLERAGMRVIWQAETDPYASRVLAKHWPDVPNLGDVTTIDWENDGLDYGDGIVRSLHVDVLAGGFPCQPVSVAGRRLAQRDERWLWPAFARAVRLLGPRYVLVENVPGLLIRGMGDVLGDLAASGYDTEWTGIPAAAVGAPHLRWRIFIVGHAWSERREAVGHTDTGYGGTVPAEPRREPVGIGSRSDVAYTAGQRHGQSQPRHVRGLSTEPHTSRVLAYAQGSGLEGQREGLSRLGRSDVADTGCEHGRTGLAIAGRDEQSEPAEEPERCGALDNAMRRRHGASDDRTVFAGRNGTVDAGWWESEPDVGRVAHGIPNRVDRLRCLGNAVVPQVAEFVGRRIAQFDGSRDD